MFCVKLLSRSSFNDSAISPDDRVVSVFLSCAIGVFSVAMGCYVSHTAYHVFSVVSWFVMKGVSKKRYEDVMYRPSWSMYILSLHILGLFLGNILKKNFFTRTNPMFVRSSWKRFPVIIISRYLCHNAVMKSLFFTGTTLGCAIKSSRTKRFEKLSPKYSKTAFVIYAIFSIAIGFVMPQLPILSGYIFCSIGIGMISGAKNCEEVYGFDEIVEYMKIIANTILLLYLGKICRCFKSIVCRTFSMSPLWTLLYYAPYFAMNVLLVGLTKILINVLINLKVSCDKTCIEQSIINMGDKQRQSYLVGRNALCFSEILENLKAAVYSKTAKLKEQDIRFCMKTFKDLYVEKGHARYLGIMVLCLQGFTSGSREEDWRFIEDLQSKIYLIVKRWVVKRKDLFSGLLEKEVWLLPEYTPKKLSNDYNEKMEHETLIDRIQTLKYMGVGLRYLNGMMGRFILLEEEGWSNAEIEQQAQKFECIIRSVRVEENDRLNTSVQDNLIQFIQKAKVCLINSAQDFDDGVCV